MVQQGHISSKYEVLVGWNFSLSGWLKMNSDRDAKGNPGLATMGAVAWDSVGTWVVLLCYEFGTMFFN